MATVTNNPLLNRRGSLMDLSRLNEAERRVLTLLAEGHTAKSISNTIGSTPAAVNERLREARRKTGAGSSRELARLLKAQENRDEQIGVGSRHRIAEQVIPDAADPRRRHTGVYAMFALFAVAAAGAAILMIGQPAAESRTDPLIAPLEEVADVAELHAKLRAEQRGPWAVRMEEQIEARLMALRLVGKGGNALRVSCGSTICEVAGTLPGSVAGFSRARGGRAVPPSEPGQTPFYLVKLGLRDGDIQKLGVNNGKSFIRWDAPDKPFLFLLYYPREDAAAKRSGAS